MSPTLTCLALALMGVDLGYRPAENGGVDFVVHVNPATLQAARPGQPLDFAVPREARQIQVSHFSVTPGNEPLPGEVPSPSLLPPGTAPLVPANPLITTGGSATISSPYAAISPGPVSIAPPAGFAPRAGESQNVPPSNASPTGSTEANGGPGLDANNSQPASSGGPAMADLPQVGAGRSNPSQPNQPWLVMWLLLIALAASNGYVGWLFWDARQRYLALLRRTFSLGQPVTDA